MNDQSVEAPRLEVERVTVAYGGLTALVDVTFQTPGGVRVAVVGPNGAGKSTLFKALAGLLPLRAGRIRLHGRGVGESRTCLAYVPQREEVDWHFPVTVADVVMMGRYGRQGWLGGASAADREAVNRTLERMDLKHLAGCSIGELSGGQQQRVFLARALAQEPHILLMDEPFTGMDAAAQQATLEVLAELQSQGVTVLVATHDLNLAMGHFEAVLLLNRRLVAYGPPAEVLTHANLREVFGGQALFVDGLVITDQCCPPPGKPVEVRRHA